MSDIADDNSESCYRALAARDDRFDGRFFVGVTTTGIYCRPVCTARTPRRDRCRFFPSAAAAEREGFRPCLRCRPELAPGNAPVDASSRVARMIAARIESGALNDGGSLELLADEIGLGSRQVRRVVQRELGVSPIELAQTHRLLLAKQLLTDTHLPAIDIALASGFGSVRRFNALFRSHYDLTPTQLRKSPKPKSASSTLRTKLSYRPPIAWEPLLSFLSARSTAGVEFVSKQRYLRTIAVGAHRGWVSVGKSKRRRYLDVELSTSLVPALPEILGRLKQLFDLNASPHLIDAHLAGDARLTESIASCPGLRVPGAFDGFELTARAILGQQISVRAATTLAGRVAQRFGSAIETPFPELTRLAPTAEAIANTTEADLKSLGITSVRSRCLLGIARSVAEGTLNLDVTAPPEETICRLRQHDGIGEWTAQYVAMRALHWPNAFPHTDLILRRALDNVAPRRSLELSQAWSPWRAYAAMHLWRMS